MALLFLMGSRNLFLSFLKVVKLRKFKDKDGPVFSLYIFKLINANF